MTAAAAGGVDVDDNANLVELAHDILVVADFRGRCTYANPAVDTILGWKVEEIVSTPYLELIHPDDLERTLVEVQRMASGHTSLNFENRYRCKDGSYRWINWTSVPVPANERMYAVGRDVTEQRAAREALEAALVELDGYSYAVSHDLRAPLRAIAGYAALILDGADDYLELAGFIRTIAVRMDELAAALLSLADIRRADLTPVDVDLTAMARAVVADLRDQDPKNRATVVVEEGLSTTGDAALLRSLLVNLVGNAWKYTRKTAEPRIEIGQKDGAFYVKDNGAGFDASRVGELFAPFRRLHGREWEGTGIGLATVRRIAHRHGGRVWAEGEVGKGACFWFTIGTPVAAAVTATAAVTVSSASSADRTAPAGLPSASTPGSGS